eukprot:351140-Chlamydomonas_euryale.AAC.23
MALGAGLRTGAPGSRRRPRAGRPGTPCVPANAPCRSGQGTLCPVLVLMWRRRRRPKFSGSGATVGPLSTPADAKNLPTMPRSRMRRARARWRLPACPAGNDEVRLHTPPADEWAESPTSVCPPGGA